MKRKMNSYKFDKIVSTMQKEFGTVPKGEENLHSMVMMPMETNMLKLFREDHARNGRRAIEAAHIALLKVDEYLTDTEYEMEGFASPENMALANGILMSFDPFTNRDVYAILQRQIDLKSKDALRGYFKEPVMCLTRIEDSIAFWTREKGPDGYFNFLEDIIGSTVPRNLEMESSVVQQKKKGGFPWKR